MAEDDGFLRMRAKFLQYGGIFDFEHDKLVYESDFKLYYDLIMGALRAGIGGLAKKPAPILFSYINNPSINTVAVKDDEFYYIGINSGVVYLLERLFNSIPP